MTKVLTGVNS